MSRLPAEVRLAGLAWALDDAETVGRYRTKIVTVPGSGCRWWSGALSGRGHGRFWLASVDGRDLVVVAHRFGFGREHGVDELEAGEGVGAPLRQPTVSGDRRRACGAVQRQGGPAGVGDAAGVGQRVVD
ncbi:MAG: hypothetical protein ACR2J0_00540 [Mycobacteriales bacterium]